MVCLLGLHSIQKICLRFVGVVEAGNYMRSSLSQWGPIAAVIRTQALAVASPALVTTELSRYGEVLFRGRRKHKMMHRLVNKPGSHGTRVTWYTGHMVHGSHGTRVTWYKPNVLLTKPPFPPSVFTRQIQLQTSGILSPKGQNTNNAIRLRLLIYDPATERLIYNC